jgi:hypothetical protein
MRELIGPDPIGPGYTFSEQVDGAYEKSVPVAKKDEVKSKSSDLNISEDDKSFNVMSSRSYRSASVSVSQDDNDDSIREGLCDPDNSIVNQDLCEDLFIMLCNPEDILKEDDEFCDWMGLTADVDWNDSRSFDDELLYAKVTTLSSSSTDIKKSGKDGFKEGMCAPESIKRRHEDLCDDIWDVMCAPEMELADIDGGLCKWAGFAETDVFSEGKKYSVDGYAGYAEGGKYSADGYAVYSESRYPLYKEYSPDYAEYVEDEEIYSYDPSSSFDSFSEDSSSFDLSEEDDRRDRRNLRGN